MEVNEVLLALISDAVSPPWASWASFLLACLTFVFVFRRLVFACRTGQIWGQFADEHWQLRLGTLSMLLCAIAMQMHYFWNDPFSLVSKTIPLESFAVRVSGLATPIAAVGALNLYLSRRVVKGQHFFFLSVFDTFGFFLFLPFLLEVGLAVSVHLEVLSFDWQRRISLSFHAATLVLHCSWFLSVRRLVLISLNTRTNVVMTPALESLHKANVRMVLLYSGGCCTSLCAPALLVPFASLFEMDLETLAMPENRDLIVKFWRVIFVFARLNETIIFVSSAYALTVFTRIGNQVAAPVPVMSSVLAPVKALPQMERCRRGSLPHSDAFERYSRDSPAPNVIPMCRGQT
mmetsp:Transcript_12409/g.28611  ORF Transcript_12409/g.28611 Transcript_12409/m.28611 type:complete len:347 (+) Transcript_12409:30-1070(+)